MQLIFAEPAARDLADIIDHIALDNAPAADQLLGRVIDDQLSGRRSEPAEQDVIRQVGTYDHGHCVIPHGYGQGAPAEG